VDYVVLVLEWAFYQKKPGPGYGDLVSFVHLRCDDDVGDAGFVFHGEKDEALCCARALAGDDAAGGSDPFSIAAGAEFFGGEDFLRAEFCAAVGHGMATGGEAGAGVIGYEALFWSHLLEG